MLNLFLNLIKSIILVIGIVILVSGGVCSISVPYFLFTEEAIAAYLISALAIFLMILVGLTRSLKRLSLMMGLLFLIAGGLCSNTNPHYLWISNYVGEFLIYFAFTLCGYILVHWILASWKKSQL